MESELQCIMFSEFDPVAGPKITYQCPEEYISKEQFDTIAPYVITKRELQHKIITLKAFGHRFTGYSVSIENAKYSRNALLFNLCFVLEEEADTCSYEGLVKKLAGYMITLELEDGFISEKESKKSIRNMLSKILHDLSVLRECTIPVNEGNTIYLKVVQSLGKPPVVEDHQVPVFLWDQKAIIASQWDLTAQQLLPFIDGFNHILRISKISDIDLNIVRTAIQTLVFYGVVTLVPLFMYSNMYALTPDITLLYTDQHMQDECRNYVSVNGSKPADIRDIFMLYCSMGPGITVKDLCVRHDPNSLNVDEKALVQFGLIKGFVCRLNKYPVLVTPEPSAHKLKSVASLLDGHHSYDEICCRVAGGGDQGRLEELDRTADSDPHVLYIWK